MLLHAFHGFLGSPADFQPLAELLRADFTILDPAVPSPVEWESVAARAAAAIHLVAWDIEGFFRQGKIGTWADWPAVFAEELERRCNGMSVAHALLGYSLGGRLAFHLLADSSLPKWEQAIIVSAHPGLSHPAERAQRLVNDQEWARRFREESWAATLGDWNAQPALVSSVHLPPSRRSESAEPTPQRRTLLAEIMTTLSLGRQEDLRGQVSKYAEGSAARPRLLLVAGATDPKFVSVLRDLHSQFSEFWICEGAGHRVPWDQPHAFSARVATFLAPSATS